MTDYNHDPVVPRVGLAANLAAATAYPNELLWTSDTFRLYVEQGGAKKLVGEADFVKLSDSMTLTFANNGLHILDTNASHDLVIAPGSDLTADRVLTITTGDAARTVTLNGDPTLNDWFDQSVKQAANPTFAAPIFTSFKASGAEQLKVWTYTHTVTAGEITAQYSDITITSVTLTKVRSVSIGYYNGFNVYGHDSDTRFKSYSVLDSTTVRIILNVANAAAGDIISITIIEAV